jgi:hypothetical protein
MAASGRLLGPNPPTCPLDDKPARQCQGGGQHSQRCGQPTALLVRLGWIQLLSAALVARGAQRKAKSQAPSHERLWEVQLDMRRQFDAQGLKPRMKVKLILTK